MPEKECRKGQDKFGKIKAEGSSRTFSLTFEPDNPDQYPADRFAWYQLMYREYIKSNDNLLEIDILSSAYEMYESGRKRFDAETANWVLDAKLGSAVYKKSYGKGDPTRRENKIDDEPSWSTNYGWRKGREELYRASLKDSDPGFTGKATMHFLDLLVYYEPNYIYIDHGVMAEYDIVHQVLFRVDWCIENNKTVEEKGGSKNGNLVWEELNYTKYTSDYLKKVVNRWNQNALELGYSAMNVPHNQKEPAAFTKPK